LGSHYFPLDLQWQQLFELTVYLLLSLFVEETLEFDPSANKPTKFFQQEVGFLDICLFIRKEMQFKQYFKFFFQYSSGLKWPKLMNTLLSFHKKKKL
jgi:hypothetical protein